MPPPRRETSKRPFKKSGKIPLANKPAPVAPLALRPDAAARVLQISSRTLWSWIKSGKIQVVRPSDHITLIPMRAIEAVIDVPAAE